MNDQGRQFGLQILTYNEQITQTTHVPDKTKKKSRVSISKKTGNS
jgi:hypothetical protein